MIPSRSATGKVLFEKVAEGGLNKKLGKQTKGGKVPMTRDATHLKTIFQWEDDIKNKAAEGHVSKRLGEQPKGYGKSNKRGRGSKVDLPMGRCK